MAIDSKNKSIKVYICLRRKPSCFHLGGHFPLSPFPLSIDTVQVIRQKMKIGLTLLLVSMVKKLHLNSVFICIPNLGTPRQNGEEHSSNILIQQQTVGEFFRKIHMLYSSLHADMHICTLLHHLKFYRLCGFFVFIEDLQTSGMDPCMMQIPVFSIFFNMFEMSITCRHENTNVVIFITHFVSRERGLSFNKTVNKISF